MHVYVRERILMHTHIQVNEHLKKLWEVYRYESQQQMVVRYMRMYVCMYLCMHVRLNSVRITTADGGQVHAHVCMYVCMHEFSAHHNSI
jgi:hypothetical protein